MGKLNPFLRAPKTTALLLCLTAGDVSAAEIWQTCFPDRPTCIAARHKMGWPTVMAEELCADTGDGCAIPANYYTIPECERRFFAIKVKHGCTWDRTGIAAHCRNTAGGRNTRPEWLKAMAEGKLDTLYAKRCQ